MKTLNGAIISYGSELPSVLNTTDGTLFYKTDNVGGSQGLYICSFINDTNPGVFGAQVAKGWTVAASSDMYVQKVGDTMTGSLTVPGFLSVTQPTLVAPADAQRILIGNQGNGGTNKPNIIQAQDGVLTIGTGSTWTGNGGTLLAGLAVNAASVNGLTWQGAPVWHTGNDGAGSGLDADTLDGQQGSFYLDAGNMNTGVTSVARGGTGISSVVPGGIAYGASGTTYGFSAAGTAGFVLLSGGTGSPTWINPASLTIGNATTANSANSAATAATATALATARNITLTGGASGTASFNGTADATIAVTTNNVQGYVPNAAATANTLGLRDATGALAATSMKTTEYFECDGQMAPGNIGPQYRIRGASGGSLAFYDMDPDNSIYTYTLLMDSGYFTLNFSTTTVPYDHGVAKLTVDYQGNLRCVGNITGYASDVRLKNNITLIPDAIQKVKSLGGYEYDWNMGLCASLGFVPENMHEHGLIAQEVEKVLPDAVAPAPFNEEYKTVRYERVVSLLTAAINEQQKLIDTLMERVATLEQAK